MTEQEPHVRLQIARKAAGYANATDAARRFGWNENTYRSHENGERGLKQSVAIKYARAFNVDPTFIILGAEDTKGKGDWVVPISGISQENGNIRGFKEYILPAQAEYYALCPLSPWSRVVAVEFAASYGVFSKGDLALFHDDSALLEEVEGQHALIKTEKSEFIIRFVRRVGDSELIDLAATCPEPIRPASFSRLLRLHLIVPRSQWTKRTALEVARMPLDDGSP
ncbi:hypothetical protein EEDFHM_03529 [Methylorubrum populi]